jgi:hypothetical protein
MTPLRLTPEWDDPDMPADEPERQDPQPDDPPVEEPPPAPVDQPDGVGEPAPPRDDPGQAPVDEPVETPDQDRRKIDLNEW